MEAELQNTLARLIKEKSERQEENAHYESELQGLMNTVAELQKANKKLKRCLERANMSCSPSATLSPRGMKLDSPRNELQNIKFEKIGVESLLKESEEKVQAIRNSRKEQGRQFREKEDEYLLLLNERENEICDLHSRAAEACLEIDEYREEKLRLEKELEELKSAFSNAEYTIAVLQKTCSDLQEREMGFEKFHKENTQLADAMNQDILEHEKEMREKLQKSYDEIKEKDAIIEELNKRKAFDGSMEEAHMLALKAVQESMMAEVEKKKYPNLIASAKVAGERAKVQRN